jgi:hypothetical protein
MRWDALFADLEAAAEAQDRLEYEAEVADQARAEYAAVRLVDRIRAQVGQPLTCQLVDGRRLEGTVDDVGPQWLLLGTTRGQVLAPVHALVAVDGPGRSVALPDGEVGRRLGLGVVLRGLAVRRVPVRLTLADRTTLTGTVDRVGADHLELAVHAVDAPRRASAVTGIRLVPFGAVTSLALGPA